MIIKALLLLIENTSTYYYLLLIKGRNENYEIIVLIIILNFLLFTQEDVQFSEGRFLNSKISLVMKKIFWLLMLLHSITK